MKRYYIRENEYNFWPVFTDIMTSIMLFFLLLLVINLYNNGLISGFVRAKLIFNLNSEIKKCLQTKQAKVDIKTGSIQLESDLLFKSFEYELSEKGFRVLEPLANGFKQLLQSHSKSIYLIMIEGYADITPVRSDMVDNYDLSSWRALAVMKYFIRQMDKKHINKFCAAGYGASRQLKRLPEETKEEWLKRNRRIEIKIIVKENLLQ